MVEPLPPPEIVELSREAVDVILAQHQDMLSQLREIHDRLIAAENHMFRQDATLAEQDRQRAKMWEKMDQIVSAQGRELPLIEDILIRLGVVEKNDARDAPGIRWAVGFRRGLIWLGAITLASAVTALAGTTVAWIVNHGDAAFSWFRRGTE